MTWFKKNDSRRHAKFMNSCHHMDENWQIYRCAIWFYVYVQMHTNHTTWFAMIVWKVPLYLRDKVCHKWLIHMKSSISWSWWRSRRGHSNVTCHRGISMFVLIIIQWPLPNIWCQLISCDVRWSCCKANDLNISQPSFSQSSPGLFRKPEAKNADVVIQTPEAEVKKAMFPLLPSPLAHWCWWSPYFDFIITGPFINVDPKDPTWCIKPSRRRSTDCELRVTSMAQATTWWRLGPFLQDGILIGCVCVCGMFNSSRFYWDGNWFGLWYDIIWYDITWVVVIWADQVGKF